LREAKEGEFYTGKGVIQMKKLIPILAFLAIVGFISQAEGAASDTCGMSVTVLVSASVSVTDKPLAFGDVSAGTQDVSDSGCTVTALVIFPRIMTL